MPYLFQITEQNCCDEIHIFLCSSQLTTVKAQTLYMLVAVRQISAKNLVDFSDVSIFHSLIDGIIQLESE